jgi:hypothetical protein
MDVRVDRIFEHQSEAFLGHDAVSVTGAASGGKRPVSVGALAARLLSSRPNGGGTAPF